jgi:nicotinate phosphoribosyltransferase
MPLESSPLLTDLYQLTMLYGYFRHGMQAPALFELFARKLPPGRNFLMAAGLAQLVEYLENLRFDAEELDCVRGSGRFDSRLHRVPGGAPLQRGRTRHARGGRSSSPTSRSSSGFPFMWNR